MEILELSPDPLLDTVCPYVAGLKLEEGQEVEESIALILKMKQIFGVDLYETGPAEKVCGYLKEMTKGTGAVRETLKKYVLQIGIKNRLRDLKRISRPEVKK